MDDLSEKATKNDDCVDDVVESIVRGLKQAKQIESGELTGKPAKVFVGEL